MREHLLDRPGHSIRRRRTETDLAEIVLALDDGGPLSTMLVFDGNPAACYIADGSSGVWYSTAGPKYRLAIHAIERVSELIDAQVLVPLQDLIRRQQGGIEQSQHTHATPAELGQLQSEMLEAEEHLFELSHMYVRLRNVSQQRLVLRAIMTKRFVATAAEGITEHALDVARDCLAFLDGVYSFREARLLTGAAARAQYQTMTTGFRFEDLRETMRESGGEEGGRIREILGATPADLIDLLASSALNENRQVIVFHHDLLGGRTLFALVQAAFGELFIECPSALLSARASSWPNKSLMPIKGKRVVLFSGPNRRGGLSSAFVKELTGGDELLALDHRGKKRGFVLNGSVHVLGAQTTTPPEFDGGIDASLSGRLRFMSSNCANEEWGGDSLKYYLMHEIMTVAATRFAARCRVV